MAKQELTYEEFCDIPLLYTQGIRFDWGALRIYRNEEYGIQRQTVTKLIEAGNPYAGWRDGVVTFFLDGDTREFKTPDQLYVAYMECACGIKEVA
jgi:hypothetical protein